VGGTAQAGVEYSDAAADEPLAFPGKSCKLWDTLWFCSLTIDEFIPLSFAIVSPRYDVP
jgi:hypothetical protein